MGKGEFPSHFLYGACHLGDHGIDVVWHRSPRKDRSRIATALYTAWRILTCREHFDAIYATHYKGLELIVLLRAIGLYRRPIVVWHHQPVVKSASRLRELCGRLFYRGLDRMIFFSKKLFYDSIAVSPSNNTFTFIATGKEQRDQPTLIEAFNRTRRRLRLFIGINPDPNVPNPNLDAVRRCKPADNIEVKEICGLLPYEIAIDVAHADCVVICCHKTRYTAGLTTVVEALALGKPIICSRNPQIPVDFDREGCGISVEYGDVEGWQRAIEYIATHPDEARRMGQRGREIAERLFNDKRDAEEIAEVIKETVGR